jgi:hypothetical protein
LNTQPDKVLLPYTNALTLANEMSEFFIHKVSSLREKLTEGDLPDVGGDERTDVSKADITFSEFSIAIARGRRTQTSLGE